MINLPHVGRQLHYICSVSWTKLGCLCSSIRFFSSRLYRCLLLCTNYFLLRVVYFVFLSSLGFWVLRCLKSRTHGSFDPRSLDLFFTTVSAATVSSMSAVEMEVFSNAQLVVLTVLMFAGGEVFTSMVGLNFRKRRLEMLLKTDDKVASVESGFTQKSQSLCARESEYSRYLAVRFLRQVVFVYLVAVHVLGIVMVRTYIRLVSSASDVLRNKGLNVLTFSIFTTVSTFASCGFVPTNENMMVFSENSALLLMLILQVLLGNTLFPPCLRFCIWSFDKLTNKAEASYVLKNTSEIGYLHLLPKHHCQLLVATVFGFIGIQFFMFCALQWSSDALGGLDPYEKTIGILFQCVNSRHTGETIVDLSTIAPAVLVLFIVMMYLPPYTSFLPVENSDEDPSDAAERSFKPKTRGSMMENLVFSQLSYLAIFVGMICITEREKMKEDPLNFNVLNIVVEVVSAYGNVGFTAGYSCKRQLKPEVGCTDKWFGFAGRWSDQGKVILIVVMFFGRLKKFNMNGGRGWKLL